MYELLIFFALLDDRLWTGLDRHSIPPHIVAVAPRMLFLKENMSWSEVDRILGNEIYFLVGRSVPPGFDVSYEMRPDCRLTLKFSPGKHVNFRQPLMDNSRLRIMRLKRNAD
jgi:hypothetical protein